MDDKLENTDEGLSNVLQDTLGKTLHNFNQEGENFFLQHGYNQVNFLRKNSPELASYVDSEPTTHNFSLALVLFFLGRKHPDVIQNGSFGHLFQVFKEGDNMDRGGLSGDLKHPAKYISVVLSRFRNVVDRDLPREWPQDDYYRENLLPMVEMIESIVESTVLEKVVSKEKSPKGNKEQEVLQAVGPKIEKLQDVKDYLALHLDIEVVSFDLMDTLIQWTCNVEERHDRMFEKAAQIFSKYGVDITKEEYRKIRSGDNQDGVWYRLMEKFDAERKDFHIREALSEIVKEVYKYKGAGLKGVPVFKLIDELEESVYVAEQNCVVATPGAKELLEKLEKEQKKIVVFSNANFSTDFLRKLLQKTGLLNYIDKLYSSCDVGVKKAHEYPDAFNFIKRDIGCDDGQKILHTGDGRRKDCQAALNAGWHGLHYYNPQASVRRLKSLAYGSKEYTEESLNLFKESKTSKTRDYICRGLDQLGVQEDSVESSLVDLYEIARDIYGPVLVDFCHRNLRELDKNPGALNLCVGRDALGMFLVQRSLLKKDSKSYPNVDARSQVKFASLSRELLMRVLRDSGETYKPNYSPDNNAGRIEKIIFQPNECRGYREIMRKYLGDLEFHEANKVFLVDHGINGSIQDALSVLYPYKKIEGRYLLSRKKVNDENADSKKGYLIDHDHRTNIFKGDGDVCLDPTESIYLMEDLFNGVMTSSVVFGRNKGPRCFRDYPNKDRLDFNKQVDPLDVPQHFHKEGLYRLYKRIILRGMIDSVDVYLRGKELDLDCNLGVLPSPRKNKKKLAAFLRSYIERTRTGNWRVAEIPLRDALTFLIRRVEYKNNTSSGGYSDQWEAVLREGKTSHKPDDKESITTSGWKSLLSDPESREMMSGKEKSVASVKRFVSYLSLFPKLKKVFEECGGNYASLSPNKRFLFEAIYEVVDRESDISGDYDRRFWKILSFSPEVQEAFINAGYDRRNLSGIERETIDIVGEMVKLQLKEQTTKNFWRILNLFPDLKKAFKDSGYSWNKLSDGDCRFLKEVHRISGVVSAVPSEGNYNKRFWKLLNCFPEEMQAFKDNGYKWGKLSEDQRYLLMTIDKIARVGE